MVVQEEEEEVVVVVMEDEDEEDEEREGGWEGALVMQLERRSVAIATARYQLAFWLVEAYAAYKNSGLVESELEEFWDEEQSVLNTGIDSEIFPLCNYTLHFGIAVRQNEWSVLYYVTQSALRERKKLDVPRGGGGGGGDGGGGCSRTLNVIATEACVTSVPNRTKPLLHMKH
ncbi:hypothetical protein M0802_007442 [Mischocyttarus mexicanus]|nr:hypothetical protein M0802_007442 [Mischocyttarus mexicanus]